MNSEAVCSSGSTVRKPLNVVDAKANEVVRGALDSVEELIIKYIRTQAESGHNLSLLEIKNIFLTTKRAYCR